MLLNSFEINLRVCTVPAVSGDRSGVRRIAGFDPAEEVEEGGRVLWHSVIRPSCKLELTHLSPLTAATLIQETSGERNITEMICPCVCVSCISLHY